MAFKCTNASCPYGPEWDEGLEVTTEPDGTVAEYRRADSYSQTPSYHDPSVSNFRGLCLNCHDDFSRDIDDTIGFGDYVAGAY